MDEALYQVREQEMRKKFPAMFNHPGCKEGEVWLGDQLIDFVGLNCMMYRSTGLPSARMSDEDVLLPFRNMGMLAHRSLFANLRELIEANEVYVEEGDGGVGTGTEGAPSIISCIKCEAVAEPDSNYCLTHYPGKAV